MVRRWPIQLRGPPINDMMLPHTAGMWVCVLSQRSGLNSSESGPQILGVVLMYAIAVVG
jgi:hypothetical protein